MPNTKTAMIGNARRHDRPPLLRALEYLLYAALVVVLVLPPACIYGLIIRDSANFRDYGDVRNFYDDPYFVYGVYNGYYGTDYNKVAEGEKFEYSIGDGWRERTDTYTMVENPVYTFEDGTSAMLWHREDGLFTYVLENGDFLMSVCEMDSISLTAEGWQYDLSDEAIMRIADVVKARLPFDVEQSLERVYAKTKGRSPIRDYSGDEMVGYDAWIEFATDEYVFVEASNFGVDENGDTFWLPEAYYIFDRATGEQVSIDRFCVGGSFEDIRLELTRRMFEPKLGKLLPPYEDIKLNEQELAEAAAALVPELINFGERGMFVELPAGCVSTRPDEGFYIAAYYFAVEDLIKVEGIVERVG